jgi:putative FmdB family regulatory protein
MPRYDYECPQCKITFEQVTPYEVFGEAAPVACQECRAALGEYVLAKRLLCAPAAIHVH